MALKVIDYNSRASDREKRYKSLVCIRFERELCRIPLSKGIRVRGVSDTARIFDSSAVCRGVARNIPDALFTSSGVIIGRRGDSSATRSGGGGERYRERP